MTITRKHDSHLL